MPDIAREHMTKSQHGSHNSQFFIPASNVQALRCPKCSLLMAQDFVVEGQCPNCNWVFKKRDARDMYIEALGLQAGGGAAGAGWNQESLELLENAPESVMLRPDGTKAPMSEVMRNLAAYSVEQKRKAAKAKMIQNLRRQAANAELM